MSGSENVKVCENVNVNPCTCLSNTFKSKIYKVLDGQSKAEYSGTTQGQVKQMQLYQGKTKFKKI